MKKTTKFVLSFILLISFLMFFGIRESARKINEYSKANIDAIEQSRGIEHKVIVKLHEKTDELNELKRLYQDVDSLSTIMYLMGLQEYDRETMNCYDQSKMVQKMLADDGMLSYIAVTEDSNDDGLGDHAYILMGIEATSGEFAKRDDVRFGPIKEIRDLNQKVICN